MSPPREGWRRNHFPLCFPGVTRLVDRPCCGETVRYRPGHVRPRSGTHPRRVQHQQPFEVTRHGLQEGCDLILRHPAVTHALRPLRKHPFAWNSQTRIPSVSIPVLRGHVVPLDRRQMTSPLGRSLARWGRAIASSAYTAPPAWDRYAAGPGHPEDSRGAWPLC